MSPNQYDFPSGQYPYPLNRVLTSGGDFDKEFIEGDPEDVIADVDNWYVICATPEQMSKIQSSLEVGAPIAFPDFYNDVLQLLDQAIQFPNSFGGAPCVDICQLILECLQTNPAVQDAVFNIAAGNTQSLARDNGQLWNDLVLASGFNDSCNLDVLWAQCFGIIDTFSTLNNEFFALWEVQTNELDFMAEVIGGITGIDETSVDAFLSWLQQMQDNIAENYVAQDTLAYRQEVACQIFCAAIEADCAITATLIFNVFKERIGSSISITGLLTDLLLYLAGGEWSGSQIADFMYMSQAGFRSLLGNWLDKVAWNDIDLLTRLYKNDANNDWEVLCEECPQEWSWNSDFPTEQNIWIPQTNAFGNMATWAASTGWSSVDIQNGASNYGRFCAIKTSDFTATEITEVTINYNLTKGSYTSGAVEALAIVAVRSGGSQVRIDVPNSGLTTGDNQNRTLTVNMTDIVRITTYVRSNNATTPSYSGACKINSVQVSGVGLNPFEA